MAKTKRSNKAKKTQQSIPSNALPQNILNIGERVEEDTNIYISQSVYKQIHKFTQNKTTNESGGVLIGTVVEALGKTNLLIEHFIEAKFCEATPTTLTFTHESWDYIHKELNKRYSNMKILGWIHTHPNFGIFLSEYDKFIHQNFFADPTQVAYVVDPIQNIEGFYFWINGKLEKCKGFYIYDKVGSEIKIKTGSDEPKLARTTASPMHNFMLLLLSVLVAILLFMNLGLRSSLNQLKEDYQTLSSNTGLIISYLQSEVSTLKDQLSALQNSYNDHVNSSGNTQETEPSSPEGDGNE
jgi:proteasome lid subunit RPN8/RPN11